MSILKNSLKTCLSKPSGWVFLLGLGLLPFCLLGLYFFNKMHHFSQLEQRIDLAHKKAIIQKIQKEKDRLFLSKIKNVDHFYIDKNLENLLFLEPEIKKLQSSTCQSGTETSLLKRLSFLKDGANKLVFSEEKIRISGSVQEVEEKQQHAVEMNEDDLKKLLSLLEGAAIGAYAPQANSPQLIIKNFELAKKPISSDEDVYVVNMQLIKRECLPTLKKD